MLCIISQEVNEYQNKDYTGVYCTVEWWSDFIYNDFYFMSFLVHDGVF